jgi:hypothetical protein
MTLAIPLALAVALRYTDESDPPGDGDAPASTEQPGVSDEATHRAVLG